MLAEDVLLLPVVSLYYASTYHVTGQCFIGNAGTLARPAMEHAGPLSPDDGLVMPRFRAGLHLACFRFFFFRDYAAR